MSFNSLDFALFFIIVYAGYLALRRNMRAQNLLLLGASYLFYGWWDVRFLFLIIVSTVIDYSCGLLLHHGRLSIRERLTSSLYVLAGALLVVYPDWEAFRGGIDWASIREQFNAALQGTELGRNALWITALGPLVLNAAYFLIRRLSEDQRRRACLILSVVANLGMLGFFKYFDFFASSVRDGLASLGMEANPFLLEVMLPVGISFYTFQTLSYTIDVYRRKVEPTRDFVAFGLFVSFFPQLVAGPIERASHLLPQMLRPRTIHLTEVHAGLYLILWGLFKKIVIADNMAFYSNEVYNSYWEYQGLSVFVATVAFAFQIYCDFSAYSDIARGCGKLLGFDLMVNFRLPYFAVSPSDFWRRWHISLSTWLRDYLYIPLGGNRGGKFSTQRNLMITMLLGGLWHGAAWNFVLWGFFHGLILAIYRVADKRPLDAPIETHKDRIGYLTRIAIMTVLTLIGWVLFRATGVKDSGGEVIATSLDQIVHMLTGWMTLEGLKPGLKMGYEVFFFAAPLLFVQFLQFRSRDMMVMTRLPAVLLGVWYGLLIAGIFVLGARESVEFIYFQF